MEIGHCLGINHLSKTENGSLRVAYMQRKFLTIKDSENVQL